MLSQKEVAVLHCQNNSGNISLPEKQEQVFRIWNTEF